jgi:hypothetical protein
MSIEDEMSLVWLMLLLMRAADRLKKKFKSEPLQLPGPPKRIVCDLHVIPVSVKMNSDVRTGILRILDARSSRILPGASWSLFEKDFVLEGLRVTPTPSVATCDEDKKR